MKGNIFKQFTLGLGIIFQETDSWLKILFRLTKPGIATQKYKKIKLAKVKFTQLSLNSVNRWLSENSTRYH